MTKTVLALTAALVALVATPSEARHTHGGGYGHHSYGGYGGYHHGYGDYGYRHGRYRHYGWYRGHGYRGHRYR